ncbi:sugar transferase [Shimia sediminis]|uniref:sugar transferase n=1 Tax=Shimia sediminis TaxID=2497945 RepID=UPI000F8F44C7|nr:sugar transferase [Shimia sediminis]
MSAFAKRLFDIFVALSLGVILMPVVIAFALLIAISDGPPVFYVSERMRTPDRSFRLWKLRTMRTDLQDSGVTGGDKADRITPIGHILRKLRLDEIPQLWNVLRGDMSLVGPRPPLPHYVERYPKIYGPVLQSRPGVTGLATLVFHRHEERLLSHCKTPQETEETYVRVCIPRKARLDQIYANNRSLRLDIWILWQTLRKILPC